MAQGRDVLRARLLLGRRWPVRNPTTSTVEGEPVDCGRMTAMQFGRRPMRSSRSARSPALARKDGHRVRRPPVLPADDEPSPPAPRRHYAEATTQFGQNVVVGNYVYSILLGMSVPDISGKAIANLEIEH